MVYVNNKTNITYDDTNSLIKFQLENGANITIAYNLKTSYILKSVKTQNKSKAFLTSAKEVSLRSNSGLTLQTMYMNMAKALSMYTVQGISKVSLVILGSTMFGNMIG